MTTTVRPYRITVVCLGNICRSPIGEAVLRSRLDAAGLGDRVVVDSAGTGDWHIGHGANSRSMTVLETNGYQLDHTARQIGEDWLADIDLLLAMDVANHADLEAMVKRSGSDVELRMFRSFDPQLVGMPEPHPDLDVPDPYHGGPEDFENVLRMVERASEGVVSYARAVSDSSA